MSRAFLTFAPIIKTIYLQTMAKIFVCLPLMDEPDNIGSLLACLHEQSFTDFRLIACVNQPDAWWEESEKKNRRAFIAGTLTT